jgi:hypothetical protein
MRVCFIPILVSLSLALTVRAAGAPTKACALLVDGWRHRIWAAYPIEKFKADDALPLEPKAEAVALTAARGEAESFVLVLRSEVPMRQVELVPGTLSPAGAGGRSAIRLEVKRLGYILIDEPSGTRIKAPMPYATGAGEYPDPLLGGGGHARPGRNLQFLVTAHVGRDAKPGRYEGRLTLSYRHEGWMPADKTGPSEIPFTLTVRPFALPEVSPLLNTAVASPQALPLWLNRPDVLAALHRDFIAHGQVPDPLPSPVVRREKDGSLFVDSAAWEQAASALLDEARASHLFLPVWSSQQGAPLQGVYFLWHYPAVTRQRWFGAPVCNEDGSLTADFQALFGAYLKHMQAVIARRGWQGKLFITTMDEPYTYHLHDESRGRDTPENNYRVIGHFVRFVRATAPGLRTFATADPAPGLEGLIDHWCLRNLQHAAKARERAEKFGETVTFCDNYRTFIDFPAASARSLGWLAWKIGASGWLTYETMGDFTTTWEGPAFVYPHFGGGTVWGMGQLFYPDTRGSGQIAPSLRWELMREGCDDYAYLWLLRERLRALSAAQRELPDAQRAQQLLASAAADVVGGSGDAETASAAGRPNAQSNRVPHDLRNQAGDLIEQLNTLGAP